LREALEKARAEGRDATDCAQLVEALGVRVYVVAGDADNWKITGPEDLAAAERVLAARPASFAAQASRSEPQASEGHRQASRSEPQASEGHRKGEAERRPAK